jgi:hypothetical protein
MEGIDGSGLAIVEEKVRSWNLGINFAKRWEK